MAARAENVNDISSMFELSALALADAIFTAGELVDGRPSPAMTTQGPWLASCDGPCATQERKKPRRITET